MNNNNNFTIALPKGRILDVVLPILKKVGIEPEKSFFDEKDRKLMFKSNVNNINIIRVRSFDVVTFLAYGAAQMAFVGSDVLTEFDHSEVYSPFDLNIGKCRMVVAAQKEMLLMRTQEHGAMLELLLNIQILLESILNQGAFMQNVLS